LSEQKLSKAERERKQAAQERIAREKAERERNRLIEPPEGLT